MNENGLTTAEVKALAAEGKINRMPEKSGHSVPSIFFHQIFTYFNAIFALLALLLILTGSFRSLTFLPVETADEVLAAALSVHVTKSEDFRTHPSNELQDQSGLGLKQ